MVTRNEGGRGDEVFRSLYGRFYGRMLRFFRTVFRLSEDDAKELAQESFLRFYRTIDEYRGDAEWALLETIARNVGYNHVRSLTTIKRGVRPESLDDTESSHKEPAAAQRHPLDDMIKAERRTRLQQAILQLPKGQQQCLRLWLDDRSYEEIAKELRISLDAVKSRIRDAKRLLRERLGDEGALPEE